MAFLGNRPQTGVKKKSRIGSVGTGTGSTFNRAFNSHRFNNKMRIYNITIIRFFRISDIYHFCSGNNMYPFIYGTCTLLCVTHNAPVLRSFVHMYTFVHIHIGVYFSTLKKCHLVLFLFYNTIRICDFDKLIL